MRKDEQVYDVDRKPALSDQASESESESMLCDLIILGHAQLNRAFTNPWLCLH